MMKKIAIICCLTLILLSCNKDNNDNSNDSWSFTWTHENVIHMATEAAAYITQAGVGMGSNQIIANIGTPGAQPRVSILLTSLNPDTYPVSVNTNRFDYVDDAGNDLRGAAGTVTISANSGNKLSGDFSVKLINPSSDTTMITGSFTDINVHP